MDTLITKFGKSVNPECPLSEYPRPQLVRDNYFMLNGKWEYSIRHFNRKFDKYDGEIVVPFSPEATLSGVDKHVTPNDVLYYKKEFNYEKPKDKDRVLLHFGAVDYIAEVTLNGVNLGKHKGGFLPFEFDVTDCIKEEENILEVKVTDPTDTQPQARGKQRLKRGWIFYTAQSGIWQSVWLEAVNDNYVDRLRLTPNIDKKTLSVELISNYEFGKCKAVAKLNNEVVVEKEFTGNSTELELEEVELWSPENPVLYDLEIEADKDKITSYFAMRKFSTHIDKTGKLKFNLNNKAYFPNGLLDQGYWPDGLLTAPTDEAMIYDIQTMKDMGFNMLRKHIKIEPLRWYYHCDRLGMLVWQDFVNGGGKEDMIRMGLAGMLHIKVKDSNYAFFSRTNSAGRAEFLREVEATINHLYNEPCISVWVPFNEGWGQFDSKLVVSKIEAFDKTRLIDHASGWVDQGIGDFRSLHIYSRKVKIPKDERCVVLSEFGGLSLPIEEHYIKHKKPFGYKFLKNKDELLVGLQKMYERDVVKNIKKGLSATVYTQVSDVEDEINGLFTYDREVLKVDKTEMKKINDSVYKEFHEVSKRD